MMPRLISWDNRCQEQEEVLNQRAGEKKLEVDRRIRDSERSGKELRQVKKHRAFNGRKDFRNVFQFVL